MDMMQFWELVKLLLVAYVAFTMNKNDRDHREARAQQNELFKELFQRIGAAEVTCAGNHGRAAKKGHP